MSINEHADEFAGLPVRDFDPEAGIEVEASDRQEDDWDFDSYDWDGVLRRYIAVSE